MKMTRFLAAFIACLAISGALSPLPAQSSSLSVEQQLRSQYRVASVGGNGVVVRAGAVVVVQKDGITALPAPSEWPCNSYKQGTRIKQSTMCAVNYSISKDQTRPLQVGEKAYLTAIQVKPTEVVFKLQTCCGDANDAPFRAGVSFQFGKGYMDSMNVQQIRDVIGEVFAIDTGSSSGGSAQSPSEGQEETRPGQSSESASVSGAYVNPVNNATRLDLSPDGTYSTHWANGRVDSGHFTVSGDELLMVRSGPTAATSWFSIRGDKLYPCGLRWANCGSTPFWSRHVDAPPPTPLKLPATYVSAQTATDQLQLNADNSFSLQEAGQSYHGTFAVNGNTVELTISETNTKTTATMQGSNLTDSSGQTWVLREQSAGTAPAAATLNNDDIVKMAKAGFDDAIIVAKIGSSKCQFDTSTDALIHLKQSGVSAAVLKAMVGARQ